MHSSRNKVAVTGMGIIAPTGIGKQNFTENLKTGATNFSLISFPNEHALIQYPAAQIAPIDFKAEMAKIGIDPLLLATLKMRNISRSTHCGIFAAFEAWTDASFGKEIDPSRIAIVSAGSNTQQLNIQQTYQRYEKKIHFLNPTYGMSFFDTDLIGVLSELLSIKGEGYTIGAASASGNMAVIQGYRLISSNEYDAVVVVAPMMDISMFEYQAFTALGAMANMENNSDVSEIYRPFDKDHCGFVHGQSAGCLILESERHALQRGKRIYGYIEGFGISLDANRKPDPSQHGEFCAMKRALEASKVRACEIDYVNTHGSGSVSGDETEVAALLSLGLKGVKANSTKSLIGHGITAAGVVEIVTSFIQMNEKFLHKSNNLLKPLTQDIDWIIGCAEAAEPHFVMSNSFGFGGINTSLILKSTN